MVLVRVRVIEEVVDVLEPPQPSLRVFRRLNELQVGIEYLEFKVMYNTINKVHYGK